MSASGPHQSTQPWRASESHGLDAVDTPRARRACHVSHMSVVLDRDQSQEPGCRELLALHELRRSVERVANRDQPVWCASVAMTRSGLVRELLELIAAIDRRMPQMHRAGEASIARDAASLKARALRRIDELERDQTRVGEI
jgi:hypothetical protein